MKYVLSHLQCVRMIILRSKAQLDSFKSRVDQWRNVLQACYDQCGECGTEYHSSYHEVMALQEVELKLLRRGVYKVYIVVSTLEEYWTEDEDGNDYPVQATKFHSKEAVAIYRPRK